MYQLIQNLRDGSLTLTEVPTPQLRSKHLLIQSSRSLISAGTERMLVEFGRRSLLAKARSQPERVKQVLDKMRTDGVLPTLEAVFAKLDEPMPLGYCNAGVVVAVGEGVTGFEVGDRVVSNGPHAEVVCVPKNLCARIPEGVSDEEAAFTVLGAIALQGMRLAQPTLGETVAVLGLGLVGLLAVQLLQANGCRVIGFDVNPERVELARRMADEQRPATKDQRPKTNDGRPSTDGRRLGGEGSSSFVVRRSSDSFFTLTPDFDPIAAAMDFTHGRGVDAVLITAATSSSEPVHQAARMCRKKGRIVLVGVTGLELNRADFYEKELSFQVSCSYGPGRYDPFYEEQGHDYPLGYVRWTEQRNFEAVLELMAAGKLGVRPLITHRFPFEKAPEAYDLITNRREPYLGIVLEYPTTDQRPGTNDERRTTNGQGPTTKDEYPRTNDQRVHSSSVVVGQSSVVVGQPIIGVIGAGNFTKQVILPALKKTPARLKSIASSGGVSGTHLAKKFGFEQSTTDYHAILADPDIQAVFITTRHNQHARMVMEALQAGKHVFVEKPLAIAREELDEVKRVWGERTNDERSRTNDQRPTTNDERSTVNDQGRMPADRHTDEHSSFVVRRSSILHVGFNRRFAPHVQKMKQLLQNRTQPLAMVMTVNAGMIPADHWIQDPAVGGGRIIGEGCHFVDLLVYLAEAPVIRVTGQRMGNRTRQWDDVVSFTLHFEDGSIGTVHYLANGHRSYPKERLEVFSEGRILVLDNFRRLIGYGWKGFRRMRTRRQDKGHEAEIAAFVECVQNGSDALIPFEQLVNVTETTFAVVEAVWAGRAQEV